MDKIQKIKKIFLVALGFALATYLIMSGSAILKNDTNSTLKYQKNK